MEFPFEQSLQLGPLDLLQHRPGMATQHGTALPDAS